MHTTITRTIRDAHGDLTIAVSLDRPQEERDAEELIYKALGRLLHWSHPLSDRHEAYLMSETAKHSAPLVHQRYVVGDDHVIAAMGETMQAARDAAAALPEEERARWGDVVPRLAMVDHHTHPTAWRWLSP